MKVCPKCLESKDEKDFYKKKKSIDGLQPKCKSCSSIWARENKDRINERKKIYYQRDREKILADLKIRRRKSSYKETRYKWKERNAAILTVYYREKSRKLRKNPQIKLKTYISNRIRDVIKKHGVRKSHRTVQLLGCEIEYLRMYLEDKFQPGMSWGNYGKWHVDHIKPCCSFDLTDFEQQKQCFHFSNLRPLWAIDNLRKGLEDKKLKKIVNN